jgi:hypothetical protein
MDGLNRAIVKATSQGHDTARLERGMARVN